MGMVEGIRRIFGLERKPELPPAFVLRRRARPRRERRERQRLDRERRERTAAYPDDSDTPDESGY